jgi:hypothetical protein
MREVETKHENMRRERLHGKQLGPEPRPHQANDEIVCDSGNEPEDPTTESLFSNTDGDESDDEDCNDSEVSSGGDEGDDDSDEITSEGGHESYGLADP